MKRKIFILVALFMLFGITATAENVGDVIGAVYPTDIITDICGYEIQPSLSATRNKSIIFFQKHLYDTTYIIYRQQLFCIFCFFLKLYIFQWIICISFVHFFAFLLIIWYTHS